LNIRSYESGKKIVQLDGEYVRDYNTGKKLAVLESPGMRGTLAAAAYLLFN